MRLFRLPKREPGRFEQDPLWLRIARYILILLLFSAVGFGFWLNAQRQAAMLTKPLPQVIDKTGSLSDEQQKQLTAYTEKFLATYGVAIVIRIQNDNFPEDILPADEKTKTLFLGLAIRSGQVRLDVPPLAAAALEKPFTDYLRRNHFPPYFARNNWQEGLATALNLLTERLDRTLSGQESAVSGFSPGMGRDAAGDSAP